MFDAVKGLLKESERGAVEFRDAIRAGSDDIAHMLLDKRRRFADLSKSLEKLIAETVHPLLSGTNDGARLVDEDRRRSAALRKQGNEHQAQFPASSLSRRWSEARPRMLSMIEQHIEFTRWRREILVAEAEQHLTRGT